MSERAQAIFNRLFFDSYSVPEELNFGEIRAFVVSARHFLRALDTPKLVSSPPPMSALRSDYQYRERNHTHCHVRNKANDSDADAQ